MKILPPTVAAAGANPALAAGFQQGLTLATAATPPRAQRPGAGRCQSVRHRRQQRARPPTPPPAAAARCAKSADDEVGVITVSAHSPDRVASQRDSARQCPRRRVQRRRRRRPVLHQQQGQVVAEHRFAASGHPQRVDRVPCWVTTCPRPPEESRRRVAAGCGSGFCWAPDRVPSTPGMTKRLYRACPPYRDHPHVGRPPPSTPTLRGILMDCSTSMLWRPDVIDTTEYAQPALFAVVVCHRRGATRPRCRARRS